MTILLATCRQFTVTRIPARLIVGADAYLLLMFLLSHPTGNLHVRHAALGLHRAGLLREFWTGINYAPPAWLSAILPKAYVRRLQTRAFPAELDNYIRTHPWRQGSRILSRRLGLSAFSKGESSAWSEDAIAHSLDRHVAKRLSEAEFAGIYAYENGAENAFLSAKSRDQLCIYDQPTGHWSIRRKILEEEAEREPEWAATLSDVPENTERNERVDRELQLADVIVVASAFAKRTIEQAGRIRARIAVVPYGAPTPPPGASDLRRPSSERLRVIYVGPLTQRLGLSYLFSAVQQLAGAAQLTVIGRKPAQPCAALDRELAKVNYLGPLSPQDTLKQLSLHDVFVLPSVYESFGSQLLDAMAMGLPIIASTQSAAPDLISDGHDGFIVPPRNANAIAERLHALYREPEQRVEMGQRASFRVREFSWRRYETTLATRISETLAFVGKGTCASFSQAKPEPSLPGVLPRTPEEEPA